MIKRLKFDWKHVIVSSLCAVIIVGLSHPAAAQITAPMNVTLHANFTKRMIMQAVRENINNKRNTLSVGSAKVVFTFKCNNNNCSPESFSPYGGSGVKARYKLKIVIDNLPDLNASLDLLLSSGCDIAQHNLTFSAHISNIDINVPTSTEVIFNLFLPGLASILVNDIEKYLTSQARSHIQNNVNNLMEAKLNNSKGRLNLPVCPRFGTTATADIVMKFAAGTQCVDGATKTASCPTGYMGTNRKWVCDNGWWWQVSDGCFREPSAPPNGQRL